ncbi:MAG: hypothetical protein LC118_11010 [Dehalococcoidia bacterium]|nr:hypothetical protein [Dehalococcoidia bacterium]
MFGRSQNLLHQIEADALDSKADVLAALRKCVALGGQSGSEALREWATRELKGYHGVSELPEYRVVQGVLALDGISGNYKVTGQQISPFSLPEPASKHITNEVRLGQPLAELVNAIGTAKASGETSIKFGLPGGADLVLLMNSENTNPWKYVERVYWQVSVSSLGRIVDVVRTNLVELVSEMRAGMGEDVEVPSKAVADQAVNVAIYGDGNRLTFGGLNQAVGNHAAATSHSASPESGLRKFMWWVVGLATIVAAVAGVLALQLA